LSSVCATALSWLGKQPVTFPAESLNPVFAVGAELDYIASYHFYDLLGSYCTDWEKTCIQGAGHWVQQEAPEAVVQTMLGWLKKRFS
jgi:pimeloyl-ACP methyl ester carboxylesterase